MRQTLSIALGVFALMAMGGLLGCSERDLSELKLAPINDDPVVFADTFGDGVDYQAFQGSVFTAVSIDASVAFAGSASLKIIVPGPDEEGGTYAGGAFTSSDYRDLSSYDALVFYAKSSINSTLNVAGLGNDNTGTSLYEAQRQAIPLTTDWSLVVVPIPDPARLGLERGLFFFAEGHENNLGFTLWFDEVRFTRLGTITSPRPAMGSRSVGTFVGASLTAEGTGVTFAVNGQDVEVVHSPRYFDYFSSDESVAAIAGAEIRAVGAGTATVTAKLDTIPVVGSIALEVVAPPTEPAPTPTEPSAEVISLFSDAYTDVPVDTWRATWSQCGPVSDFIIDGDHAKVYTGLIYAGIEFVSQLIDATDMTHVRMDVWAPEGTIFRVKLVDFGEDGIYNLPIDQSELTFNAATDPAFVPGQWSVLDIPLANYTLQSRAHLAQIVISSPNARTVFVDNVLFHR